MASHVDRLPSANRDGDTRLFPDPTVLTTSQLHREIGWVKDLIEEKMLSVRREVDLVSLASKEAVAKSELGYDKRFDSVNEFRAQMADQAAKFITRTETQALSSANSEKISALTDRINRNEGRGSGREQIWGYTVGASGLLIAIITTFAYLGGINARVDANTKTITNAPVVAPAPKNP